MKPGWYIINYHNVDWEDSLLTRAIGGTVRPDVFRRQLQQCSAAGELVSIQDGLERLERGPEFDKPMFTPWFDDGFRGLLRYAKPICEEFGVRPAVSINSRFVLRTEMFWRCKMSYLAMTDGMRFLRSRIRREHPEMPPMIRHWTLENFSTRIIEMIDEIYDRFTTARFRNDAFRIFLDENDVSALARAGWLICNHSSAHYPVTRATEWSDLNADIEECESLVRQYDPDNRFWVVPFDIGGERHFERLRERFTVVFVGNQPNTVEAHRRDKRITRHALDVPPIALSYSR